MTIAPCPCCGNPDPEVSEGGFVSCPVVFPSIGQTCPMYAESADLWNAKAARLVSSRSQRRKESQP